MIPSFLCCECQYLKSKNNFKWFRFGDCLNLFRTGEDCSGKRWCWTLQQIELNFVFGWPQQKKTLDCHWKQDRSTKCIKWKPKQTTETRWQGLVIIGHSDNSSLNVHCLLITLENCHSFKLVPVVRNDPKQIQHLETVATADKVYFTKKGREEGEGRGGMNCGKRLET